MGFEEALEKQLEALQWFKQVQGFGPLQKLYEQEQRINEIADLKGTVKEIIEHSLTYGDTYYWPSEFCSLLSGLLEGFPQEWRPHQEDFLTETGFIFFEKPIYLPEGKYPIPSAGQLIMAINEAREKGALVRDFWLGNTAKEPDEAAKILANYGDSEYVRNNSGRLKFAPMQALTWQWTNYSDIPGVCFAAWTTVGRRLSPRYFYNWEPQRDLNDVRTHMFDLNMSMGEYMFIRNAAAIITFMNQRVIAHSRENPNRATRRRISEWRPEPVVNIIRLRRIHVKHKLEEDHEPVEWAYQWVVRGHWRHQWYPKLNRHQTIWISAYAKGPEDKPLKPPRAKIFAVVR